MPTALYTTTHTTNTLYYTTLHWAFLLFQFNVQQWFGLNRYCFLSTIQVSFWAHPKTFRYFLTSLFQERKVFLFSRILSKSKYFSEVDQVCTILSRAIPFRASTERGAQYQSSPFFSVAFDTAPRRVPGQGPSYTWWWCQCDDESRCAIWACCQPIPKSLQSLPMHASTFSRSVIETNTPDNDRFIYGTVLSRTWL